MNRVRSPFARPILALSLLLGGAIGALAQTPDCAVPQGDGRSLLPRFSGSISGSALSTAKGSSFLYVMTQWGFARAPLSDPNNPKPLLLAQIGKKTAGGDNGGLIPAPCDCWQGGTTFDVAEAPDGSARMLSDWNAAKQGGGLPAQLAAAVGTAKPVFAQQIQLDGTPVGIRVAAIRLANGKYIGYIPGRYNATGGIHLVDLTDYNSDPKENEALRPFSTFSSWSANRLYAAHISVPGYEKPLMFGVSTTEKKLFVAEINATTGLLIDKTVGPMVAGSKAFYVAVVEGRIFIFSAEGTAGLQVYEYQPGAFGGTITNAGSIAGDFTQVVVKGSGGPFPAIFAHRNLTPSSSSVEIYDTKWLTSGGSAVRAGSLAHGGSTELYIGTTVEAVVVSSGPVVTAYIYRVVAPSGGETESSIRTDKLDISCIAADLTSPPAANATLSNLSAASRTGAEASKNYLGDKWRVKDASSSGAPLRTVEWDYNTGAAGPFAKDADGTPAGSLDGYLPCDPSQGGNYATAANCYTSVGSPTSSAIYYVGIRATNDNGPSTAYKALPNGAVLLPQARIAGYDGTTLRVLSGGAADAGGSDGNVAEAAFAWSFRNASGASVGSLTGASPTVPSTARSFDLTVTYRGGYIARITNKAIEQVDLVPDFSLAPNPVLNGGALALTNLMEKGATTTLSSVSYSINSTPALSGTLPGSFLPVNGTATVLAPDETGSYTIQLTYTFSGPQGSGQTITVSKPFATTDFAPSPVVVLYTNSAGTSLAPFFGGSFNLTRGTTYYLFDDETIPDGVPHPGVEFFYSTDATLSIPGDSSLGSHSADGPVSWTPSATCTTCYILGRVGGAVSPAKLSISAPGGGPPPPPPPPPSLAVTVSGPSTGVTGTPVSFTATATGTGAGSATFAWSWGDNIFGGYATGPATNSHTYSAPGTFSITVRATSGSTIVYSAARNITINPGGPPVPSASYNIAGATLNTFTGTWDAEAGKVLTFTALDDRDSAATFSWKFGDGTPNASGKTVTHAYTTSGTKNGTLTVTGGGTVTSGTASAPIKINVTPPKFQALMIPGAGSIDTDAGTWATDIAVTNAGTTNQTLTLHFEPFGTTLPGDLSTLPFDSANDVPLGAGQSWSAIDVVRDALKKPSGGKGILFIRYDTGSAPVVTSRIYFHSATSELDFGTALPSIKVGPYGQTTQAVEVASEQTLVGLRSDSTYRFNVGLFNAAGTGGVFRLDAYSEDGLHVEGFPKDYVIDAFQQAGVNDAQIGLTDPTKRYILKAYSTSGGALLAFASALDRRNNDLVQISDDTPRISAPPDTEISYYVAGVGRIGTDEVAAGPHWKTDLRLWNPSVLPRNLIFEYRYTPPGGVETSVLAPVTIGAGQGLTLDDVVGNTLGTYAPNLKTDSTQGLLRIYYRAPSDVSTAPLIVGGRIYNDQPTGTAGMQLSVYSSEESVGASEKALVMPGAEQNLRFRTNLGLFAMGDLPTRVRIRAVKQDGVEGGRYEVVLNDPGKVGHYVQVPLADLPGFSGDLSVHVEVLEGSRVGSYIVTVDQISTDTVFIQARPLD